MSANTLYETSVEAALQASGPRVLADASIAEELLRQRLAGMGGHAPGHLLSHAPAFESLRKIRAIPLESRRDLIVHAITRAYSQLLVGDAPGARRTLEHALAMSETLPAGLRAALSASGSQGARTATPATTVGDGVVPAPGARVMIRTLGTFEVLVDGVPLPEGKKQPRRTLALLKAIIALGGKDVCRTAIADALWPELDGDKAQNALTVTLHRLRNHLGVVGAIPVHHGRLSLEPRQVWVDALEFEAAARAVNVSSGYDSIERIFDLYRGPFVSAETEEPWTVRLRERLRSRFVSIVAGAGAALEAHGRTAEAAALYERGLAADDLIGAFHDGLIRCLGKLDRPSEAQAARHRKLRLASTVLG